MQTLISVFENRGDARKAADKLAKAGFPSECVHLREGEENAEVGEVAVDRGVLDSIGHFFVSLFGEDNGRATAGSYRPSMERGHSVVVVDAKTDDEAETAAVILHDQGATDVDDRESNAGEPMRPGVRKYSRSLREPLAREDSPMAERAGQVSRELKEDREERAYAAPMTHVDRDRPK